MEILSNFSSVYCYISFVIGAVLMFVALAIAAMGKDNDEPRNKVRFYVKKIDYEYCSFYIKNKQGNKRINLGVYLMSYFGLNPDDFADMKKGEIREVFINFED